MIFLFTWIFFVVDFPSKYIKCKHWKFAYLFCLPHSGICVIGEKIKIQRIAFTLSIVPSCHNLRVSSFWLTSRPASFFKVRELGEIGPSPAFANDGGFHPRFYSRSKPFFKKHARDKQEFVYIGKVCKESLFMNSLAQNLFTSFGLKRVDKRDQKHTFGISIRSAEKKPQKFWSTWKDQCANFSICSNYCYFCSNSMNWIMVIVRLWYLILIKLWFVYLS